MACRWNNITVIRSPKLLQFSQRTSFSLKRHIRFQLGLNNLFVFERNAIPIGVRDVNDHVEDALVTG